MNVRHLLVSTLLAAALLGATAGVGLVVGHLVFAAGAFTLAGSANYWTASRLLDNVWRHLTAPELTSTRGGR